MTMIIYLSSLYIQKMVPVRITDSVLKFILFLFLFLFSILKKLGLGFSMILYVIVTNGHMTKHSVTN